MNKMKIMQTIEGTDMYSGQEMNSSQLQQHHYIEFTEPFEGSCSFFEPLPVCVCFVRITKPRDFNFSG